MGRVENGQVAVGDAVAVLPSGAASRIAGIECFGQQKAEAVAGESVTLRLEDELDISRGDLLAHPDDAPRPTGAVVVTLCWLSERPLDTSAHLLLRHGTRLVRARVAEILGRLDLVTQKEHPAQELQLNDIATVRLQLLQPIAPDPYRQVRAGGAVILIEAATNATVAAGMVLQSE
jgi:sulfate adenylyltransferase subunit 1